MRLYLEVLNEIVDEAHAMVAAANGKISPNRAIIEVLYTYAVNKFNKNNLDYYYMIELCKDERHMITNFINASLRYFQIYRKDPWPPITSKK